MPSASRPALPDGHRVLLLGPIGADVVLASLDDRSADEWPDRIRASVPDGGPFGAWGLSGDRLAQACALGAVLVGRPVRGSEIDDVLGDLSVAAAHGSTVALSPGDDIPPLLPMVDALTGSGVDPASFVVELPLGSATRRHPEVHRNTTVLRELVGRGIRVGVALADRPDGAEDAVSGWEIGVLTDALLDGATLVRGVELRRAARVRAVVDALREGGAS